jgi:hypothetical protein
MLGAKQEDAMPTYTGTVIDSDEDGFPFLAIITDENGDVIGSYPVRTRTDGEAAVADALKELKDRGAKVIDAPPQ